VQVKYDPSVISFQDLLNVFFAIHDPTSLNRQGADVGTQYRSAIFYHDDEQKKIAEELIQSLNAQKIWDRPIVTVTAVDNFSVAGIIIRIFRTNQNQPYCQAVVAESVQVPQTLFGAVEETACVRNRADPKGKTFRVLFLLYSHL
jgi:peptide-methionine (S)-S-oxide reductase